MKKSLTTPLNTKLLFGHRLRERRLSLELSQESLGVSIGLDESCSKTRISRYESGQHEPKIATTQLLATCLKVPLAYLYCEKDEIAELLMKTEQMTEEQIRLLNKYATDLLRRPPPNT